MKIEYIEDGSPDCPIMRLYDFDPCQADKLRIIFGSLANGLIDTCSLHEQAFVESVGSCKLTCKVGERDQGLVKINSPASFDCILTRETWNEIEELTEPFTIQDINGFQWLDETSDVSLLLSPSGYW